MALSAGLSIVSTRIVLSAPLINASSSVVNPSAALLHEIMHNDSVIPSVSVLCKFLMVILPTILLKHYLLVTYCALLINATA